jgi:hypothetical protein
VDKGEVLALFCGERRTHGLDKFSKS